MKKKKAATATPKRAGTPKAGRKPIERLSVYLFGTPVLQVGLFAGNRKQNRTIELLTEAAFGLLSGSLKAQSGGGGGGGGRRAKPEAEAVTTPAAAAEEKMTVAVKVGKNLTGFALAPELLAEYRQLCTDTEGNHGIFINRIVPLELISEFPHDKVFFLTPVKEDAMTPAAYGAMHTTLTTDKTAALGLLVYGNAIVVPVAIVASRGGLVLWQLPQVGESNSIGEAIPPDWNQAEVQQDAREAMGELFHRHTHTTLGISDRLDPRRAFLEHVADKSIAKGVKPVRGSTSRAATLKDLLKEIQ